MGVDVAAEVEPVPVTVEHDQPSVHPWQHARSALLSAVLIVALAVVLRANWVPGQVAFAVGTAASQDVVAPRSADYVSAVLTAQERDQLGQNVGTLYRYDAGIAQATQRNAKDLLGKIASIRADSTIDDPTKTQRIEQASNGILTPTTAQDAAELSDGDFSQVADEVTRLLDQAATLQVRPEGLATTQQGLLATLPPFWSSQQAALAAQLIVSFVRPNSFPDPDQTSAAAQQAQREATPVRVHVSRGDSVVHKGETVTPQIVEELQALGLYREAPDPFQLAGTVLLIGALLLPLFAYLLRVQPSLWLNAKPLALIGLLMVVTALVARLLWNADPTATYMFPLAVVSMLVAVLLDVQLAVLLTGILAVLVGYVANDSIEVALVGLIGGLVGILAMWRIERLAGFLRAGALVALATMCVGLAFLLIDGQSTTTRILMLAMQSAINGTLSAVLTVGAFSLLGYLFGMTTSLQLMELSRPNQPLLRKLLLGAPGTYHHSIIVSNLAERAADAIDANPLLARVGAYYHDIGKLVRPHYFVENQLDQPNIHQQLAPDESARIIAAHVTDGLKMAKENHLPRRIADVIAQHHGTRFIGFFYELAKQQGGDPPDESRFRYPGPRPRTREAGIVMLADAVEATARATNPRTAADLQALLDRIFDERIREGELDDCWLTLRDLRTIKDAFRVVLSGVYHTRLDYQQVAAVSDAE